MGTDEDKGTLYIKIADEWEKFADVTNITIEADEADDMLVATYTNTRIF